MKRILALVMSLLLSLTLLAGCGDPQGASDGSKDPAMSGNPTESDREPSDSSSGDSGETQEPSAPRTWEEADDHKVIMDDSGTRIIVADLDLCGDSPEDIVIEDCIIWEWDSAKTEGGALQGKDLRIDESKYRYSSYWKKDVIIFSGSGGYIGVIDYQTKQLLFSHNPGRGPHSVELLPNGDLVAVCSGNSNSSDGCVLYYALTKGEKKPSSQYSLESAHGVVWDPENNVVWALGGKKIVAFNVSEGKLSLINGMGVSGFSGGHELTPILGSPGEYWVSVGKQVLRFDGNNGTIVESYQNSEKISNESVKGIAYFEDGSMIQTAHDQGGTGTYRSSELRILYTAYSTGKVKTLMLKEIMIPHRPGSQTYKIGVFTKNYN